MLRIPNLGPMTLATAAAHGETGPSWYTGRAAMMESTDC
jgi:hypothetical protein